MVGVFTLLAGRGTSFITSAVLATEVGAKPELLAMPRFFSKADVSTLGIKSFEKTEPRKVGVNFHLSFTQANELNGTSVVTVGRPNFSFSIF